MGEQVTGRGREKETTMEWGSTLPSAMPRPLPSESCEK